MVQSKKTARSCNRAAFCDFATLEMRILEPRDHQARDLKRFFSRSTIFSESRKSIFDVKSHMFDLESRRPSTRLVAEKKSFAIAGVARLSWPTGQ